MQMIQGGRHITRRMFEHEKIHYHKHFIDAYFLNACERSIQHNLFTEQLSLGTQQVLWRRSVLKCVIDVIFYIGFQVASYRGKRRKAVATYLMKVIMTIVGILAEYNPRLQEHLQKVIFQGKQKDSSKKGRGKFVTF